MGRYEGGGLGQMGRWKVTEKKEQGRVMGSLTLCDTSSDLAVLPEKSYLGISWLLYGIVNTIII